MKRTMNTRAAAWVLFAVLICFIGSLALPYFTYGEAGETASLLGYLSFPDRHSGLTESLGMQIEGYNINMLANVHVPVFLVAIVLAALLIFLRDNPILLGASAAFGVWGAIVYASNAVLKLGGWARSLQVGLLIGAAAIAVIALISQVVAARRAPRTLEGQAHAQDHVMAS